MEKIISGRIFYINEEERMPFLLPEKQPQENTSAVRRARGNYSTPLINPQTSILNDLGNGIEIVFNNIGGLFLSTTPGASQESQQFLVTFKKQPIPMTVPQLTLLPQHPIRLKMAPKRVTKPVKPRVSGIVTLSISIFEVYTGGSNTLGQEQAPYLHHGQRRPTCFDSLQTLEFTLDKGIQYNLGHPKNPGNTDINQWFRALSQALI